MSSQFSFSYYCVIDNEPLGGGCCCSCCLATFAQSSLETSYR